MLTVVRADITRLDVDAIVNAANPRLLPGGGVCGAIHRAAGPELEAACQAIPEVSPGVRCPTGEARLTPGFNLPARHVIHTVGPVWSVCGEEEECDRLLAECYRNCLILADEHDCASIAFPCISTGVYGFPNDRAADIAVATVRPALKACKHLADVRFACFTDTDHDLYANLLAEVEPDIVTRPIGDGVTRPNRRD